jgi:hypothetical protein
MLFTVVLDADLPISPAHIDAPDKHAEPIEDLDLCLLRPQSRVG